MTEDISNLILEHSRALRNEIASLRGDMQSEFKDVKQAPSRLGCERVDAAPRKPAGEEEAVRQQASIDRLAERIDRIEKRLDLS